MTGKFYIVGVGPGESGLVTLKATRVLASVGHIFVPVSGMDRESLAYEIAQQYIPPGTSVTELLFPMADNKEMLKEKYMRNYKKIESLLRQGEDAALITIGDPSTYSTSWPVLNLVQDHAPDIEVEVIPGITSYAHGAARTAAALVEGNEILSVVSSYDSLERIEAVIDVSDTVVFLKTYKKRKMVIDLLAKLGMLNKCMYIKRCGLEGEEIIADLEKLPPDLEYFSMIILKK